MNMQPHFRSSMNAVVSILVPLGIVHFLGVKFPAYYAFLFVNREAACCIVSWLKKEVRLVNLARARSVCDEHVS